MKDANSQYGEFLALQRALKERDQRRREEAEAAAASSAATGTSSSSNVGRKEEERAAPAGSMLETDGPGPAGLVTDGAEASSSARQKPKSACTAQQPTLHPKTTSTSTAQNSTEAQQQPMKEMFRIRPLFRKCLSKVPEVDPAQEVFSFEVVSLGETHKSGKRGNKHSVSSSW